VKYRWGWVCSTEVISLNGESGHLAEVYLQVFLDLIFPVFERTNLRHKNKAGICPRNRNTERKGLR
jgi:hypothetical protein